MKRADDDDDDDDERPVDEVALAVARRRLDALVAQHPELVGPTGSDNVNAWVETLEHRERIGDGQGTHAASSLPLAG
jgi:hypothetical protein